VKFVVTKARKEMMVGLRLDVILAIVWGRIMTLDEMWERLEQHQPFAGRRGYGEAWAKMCRERTQDTAAAAAKVAWTVRPAAPEAAKAALWSVPPASAPTAAKLAIYWIEKSEKNNDT
jgi:hypothetical protein